jgi:hypothetical protein
MKARQNSPLQVSFVVPAETLELCWESVKGDQIALRS